MSLTIELPPDVERRLEDEAARRGIEAGDLAREFIEQQLPASPDVASMTPQERAEAFRAWVRTHQHIDAPVIPLEALRREYLYDDRI